MATTPQSALVERQQFLHAHGRGSERGAEFRKRYGPLNARSHLTRPPGEYCTISVHARAPSTVVPSQDWLRYRPEDGMSSTRLVRLKEAAFGMSYCAKGTWHR